MRRPDSEKKTYLEKLRSTQMTICLLEASMIRMLATARLSTTQTLAATMASKSQLHSRIILLVAWRTSSVTRCPVAEELQAAVEIWPKVISSMTDSAREALAAGQGNKSPNMSRLMFRIGPLILSLAPISSLTSLRRHLHNNSKQRQTQAIYLSTISGQLQLLVVEETSVVGVSETSTAWGTSSSRMPTQGLRRPKILGLRTRTPKLRLGRSKLQTSTRPKWLKSRPWRTQEKFTGPALSSGLGSPRKTTSASSCVRCLMFCGRTAATKGWAWTS